MGPGNIPNPGWNVVYGEQPTASKWSELGANDDALSDGSGIQAGALLPGHLMSGAPSSWVWQPWTPTITGFSAAPSGGLYYYTQVGKTVFINIAQPNPGTSNSSNFTISLPVASRNLTDAQWSGPCQIENNGSVPTNPGIILVLADSSVANIYPSYAGGAWAGSGSQRLIFGSMFYEVA